jgi:hypothetical protein
LLLHTKIGAHRERCPTLAARIIEFAQFNNRSRCAVANSFQIGKPDVMGAPVDPVNDGVGRTAQFVVEPTTDQPADYGRIKTFRGQDITG